MRDKISYIGLILVLSFFGINSVFAKELSFTMSATADKTEVSKGSEVSITLNLRSDDAIANCTFKVEKDSGLVLNGTESMNNWYSTTGGVENSNLTSTEAYTSGKNILKYKYTVNSSGSFTIKDITCASLEKIGVNDEGEATEVKATSADVTINFTVSENDDTTLSSFKVTSGTMSESISPDKLDGSVVVIPSPTFGLSMTATNSDYNDDIVVKHEDNVIADVSKITFSDPSNQGQMPLVITVNGKTTYSLLIVYEQEDYDNSLESITLNGDKIDIVPGKYTYQYTVPKNINEVVADAKIKDTENFQFGDGTNIPTTITVVDMAHLNIVVEPKSDKIGAVSTTYVIELIKEGSSVGGTGNSSGGSGSSNGGNVTNNPVTGGISMFLMAFILIASLVGSIVLYRKNLESYK